MAGEMFQMDIRDLLKLRRYYKKSPRSFAAAVGMLLNNFAFGTRAEVFRVMPTLMTIRNKRFLETRIRAKKTHLRLPISSQQSETGSIGAKRFTAWEEQELGKRTKRTRVASILARGAKQKQIKRPFRLRPGMNFPTPDDFPGRSGHHRAIVMLQKLGREGYKKPFIVLKHKRITPGLYKFKGGRGAKRKLRMLQSFKPARLQPRRIRWLTISRRKYLSGMNLRREWAIVIERTLKKRGGLM